MTDRELEIMEKNDRDRIIRGLVCCGTKEHCHYGPDGCPWYFPENPDDCTARLARAAVTYIATLEERMASNARP